MRSTIEAEEDANGNIRPKVPVSLPPGSQLLITVLGDEPSETALLSEQSLAAEWNRPEEDARRRPGRRDRGDLESSARLPSRKRVGTMAAELVLAVNGRDLEADDNTLVDLTSAVTRGRSRPKPWPSGSGSGACPRRTD